MKDFHSFVTQEKGATAIEYGLITSLIAIAIIGALSAMGTGLNTTFATISSSL